MEQEMRMRFRVGVNVHLDGPIFGGTIRF